MVKYPLTAVTNAAKAAFVERAIELLRLEHNVVGKWFREGINLEEYQTLRAMVQSRWPYDGEKLDKIEWEKYKEERFDVKSEVLISERGRLTNLMYNSTRFSPNLDDDIV